MRGHALIIATSRYEDPGFAQLASPREDARRLHQILSDPQIGDYEVALCLDEPFHQWLLRINDLVSGSPRDELLLLYISGHGHRDDTGALYFAATDTHLSSLIATGIPSRFILDALRSKRRKRALIILDTCYSGAFFKGISKSADAADMPDLTNDFKEGTGLAVIAATSAIERAQDGDSTTGRPQPSLFTKHLITGLETGLADRDQDGSVSLDDLFRYLSVQVPREAGSQQQPHRFLDLDGDFVIASNPRPLPGKLPADVLSLMEDSRTEVRLLAVGKLQSLLGAPSLPLALAARQALERLQKDDSKTVSSAADAVLQKTPGTPASGTAPAFSGKTTPSADGSAASFDGPPEGKATSAPLSAARQAQSAQQARPPERWHVGSWTMLLPLSVLVIAYLLFRYGHQSTHEPTHEALPEGSAASSVGASLIRQPNPAAVVAAPGATLLQTRAAPAPVSDILGWATGEYLIATTNGKTWITQDAPGTPRFLYFAQDGRHGWGLEDTAILTTVDGGNTWLSQEAPTRNLAAICFAADRQHGWAVGGGVIATPDGGRTWRKEQSHTGAYLTSVQCAADGRHVWAVGNYGAVTMTADGGKRWLAQTLRGTPPQLKSLYFDAAGERGWAAGTHGTVIATQDGGQSWHKQMTGTSEDLFSVHFAADGQHGWVAGGDGTVMATTDGGESWTQQSTPSLGSLRSVYFMPDGKRGWAVGDDGVIATVDGGQHWAKQDSPPGGYSFVYFVPDRREAGLMGR